jgi:hypothetical protein
VISPDLRTACVGFFADAQCVAACTKDCILPRPKFEEDHEALLSKFTRLYPGKDRWCNEPGLRGADWRQHTLWVGADATRG